MVSMNRLYYLGRYFHAISSCADDAVPVVFLFSGFVSTRLQGVGLLRETGIICLDRGETGLERRRDVFVDFRERRL
jgi:hypothetical protein